MTSNADLSTLLLVIRYDQSLNCGEHAGIDGFTSVQDRTTSVSCFVSGGVL